jgi:hypothetical protein
MRQHLVQRADEARDAMKFRENQRFGAAFAGIAKELVLADDAGPPLEQHVSALAVASYARVKRGSDHPVARILSKKAGNYLPRLAFVLG